MTLRPSRALPLAAAVLLGAPAASPAAPVRERVLETKASSDASLTAGYGYAAWVARARTDSSDVVVLRPDGARRSVRLPGLVVLELRRQVDTNTGRVVTRLATTRITADGSRGATTLRLPATLKRTTSVFAPQANGTIREGMQAVSIVGVPEAGEPAIPQGVAPSRCEFPSPVGLPTIPALPDCEVLSGGPPYVALRGGVLTTWTGVPSLSTDAEKGSVGQSALRVYSTVRPELGWRTLATRRGDYDGSVGLQSYCVSERGVAVLEGEVRSFGPQPVAAAQTLRWHPADPEKAGWSATVPHRATTGVETGFISLRCDGAKIYGTSTAVEQSRPGQFRSRVVRYLPPTNQT